jgi:hypothetical protein
MQAELVERARHGDKEAFASLVAMSAYWGDRTGNLVEPDGSNAAPVNTEKLTFFGDQLGYGYVATWQPMP